MTAPWPPTTTETTSLPIENERAVEDLMKGERKLRASAETTARELHQVLLDLAVRFDGVRLEEMRRKTPSIPASWSAADWRKFFAAVRPQAASGWLDAEAIQREREALAVQIASLQAELAASRKVKLLPRPEPEAAPAPAPAQALSIPEGVIDFPEGFMACHSVLVADLKAVLPSLPTSAPAGFQKSLGGNGRTGSNLTNAYRRYGLALRLIGYWGMNSRIEAQEIMGCAVNLSGDTGSIRRIFINLEEAHFLTVVKLEMKSPNSALYLIRFTEDGKRLYKALFGKDPVETDWERLERLHEGERFPEHTLAVLIFALHARKRGWATRVLPPVEGTNAVPDAAVKRGDQTFYVEVELSKKESPTKWRNQAALNGGKAALCAATPAGRKRLVGDCHLDKLPGLATDLETLVNIKLQTIDGNTPLWLEEW